MKWDRIREIVDQYRTVDLFLLCVDRDGNTGRRQALDDLEEQYRNEFGEKGLLLVENAWQELEVRLLAGHWNMAVLRDNEWVSFEMDLGNEAQQKSFLRGAIPKGATLLRDQAQPNKSPMGTRMGGEGSQ